MFSKYYTANLSVNGFIVDSIIVTVWFFDSPKLAFNLAVEKSKSLSCNVQDFRRLL